MRVSGPAAPSILAELAPQAASAPARRSTLTTFRDPQSGEVLDRGLSVRYEAPASYTGEDMVELSTHGGALAPSLVLDACLRLGARTAEPGEFTQRAYLNGKVDLVQAEAVADLVEGRSRALHRTAIHHLERGLSARLEEIRQELVGIEAVLVHHVDFPEEDDAPVAVEGIAARAEQLTEGLRRILATAPEGEMLREGAVTVLAGRPNAGKSSLFNALVGEERAIVTGSPGTTRDALEANVSLGGYPFRVVDTAGIRGGGEEVERVGIEVAGRYLEGADLVLLCVEAQGVWGCDEEEAARWIGERTEAPVVLLRTKADCVERSGTGPVVGEEAGGMVEEIPVSTVSGEGLEQLQAKLPGLVFQGLVEGGQDSPVLTRERQIREARRAMDEVQRFSEALREGVPAEVAGAHLRTAEGALEGLVGVVSPEEVLDRLFGDFCIGK